MILYDLYACIGWCTMGNKDHVKQVNLEQKRQIEKYKWIESEKAGRDLADDAVLDWIHKYAISFREWAETIPYECRNCGLCSECDKSEECNQPFNEERLRRIRSEGL